MEIVTNERDLVVVISNRITQISPGVSRENLILYLVSLSGILWPGINISW